MAVEDEAALQGLWSLYEGGRLGEMLNSVLITPEALKTLHAERIQLRTRMWADERDICRQELILGKVKCNPASTKGMYFFFQMNHHRTLENILGENLICRKIF